MRRRFVAVVLVLSASVLARANPISVSVLRARQVPHTAHVQVTFGVDLMISADYAPTVLKRDGQVVTNAFPMTAVSFRTNTGSGVRETRAKQFCDCAVPVGKHDYELTYNVGQMPETLSASVNVVANLGDPPDAGGPFDMLPWEIPDPTEIQGVDCAKTCGAAPADMGSPPPGKIGCSIGSAGGAGGAGVLALVVMLGLLRRRRRG